MLVDGFLHFEKFLKYISLKVSKIEKYQDSQLVFQEFVGLKLWLLASRIEKISPPGDISDQIIPMVRDHDLGER